MSVVRDWRLGPYTVDDLDDHVRFPPDEGTYEMRDGWVIMAPWHGLDHEIIIDNAKAALRAAAARAGAKVRVITPRIATPDGLRNSRIPDIAVVDAEALGAGLRAGRKYLTEGVLMVAEVVSADRAAEDHIAKVADYAQAGIGWYWLIDTDPVLKLTVLRLVGATYVEHTTATAGETLQVGEPFPIVMEISALLDQ
jgi:Uma2 family endonuclease